MTEKLLTFPEMLDNNFKTKTNNINDFNVQKLLRI